MVRKIENLYKNFFEGNTTTDVETTGEFKYQFFPVAYSTLQFRVKAAHDAHIALTGYYQQAGYMWELILGCSKNTVSVIRKNGTKPKEIELKTPEVLDKNEFRGFWISWHRGAIFVGKEDSMEPLITWTAPKPFDVNFVGVCTSHGAIGSWKIEDLQTDGNFPEDHKFFPFMNSEIHFKVKAEKEACIALTTDPKDTKNIYEIWIGTFEHTLSVIKKNRTTPYKASVPTTNILDGNNFCGFWVKLEAFSINVGKEGNTKPFLTWIDPEPIPVFYAGFSTYLVTGTWKIPAKPACNYQNVPYAIMDNLIWLDAENGKIPLGAVKGGIGSNAETIYVARIIRANETVPGLVYPSRGFGEFTLAGTVYQEKKYQVLVRCPSETWVSTSLNKIPDGAFPGGKTEDGKLSYVGRVRLGDGTVALGSVPESGGYCAIVDGHEIRKPCYEILMT